MDPSATSSNATGCNATSSNVQNTETIKVTNTKPNNSNNTEKEDVKEEIVETVQTDLTYNNSEQLISFIYFIIVGMLLSIIFDIFRILRRTIKTSDIITNIQDILFCIITGVIIILSIFYFNKGELRLYIFIGILLGITFYMIFISKYFIKINVTIINFIKKLLFLLIKPLIIILNFTKSLFFKPISFIIINMKYFTIKNLQKIKKVTKKEKKSIKQEGI